LATPLAAIEGKSGAFLAVTPSMLMAGKRAFLANRALLDDLYEFFDCDLNHVLTEIFREMARASEES
jgi:hypothetical protein